MYTDKQIEARNALLHKHKAALKAAQTAYRDACQARAQNVAAAVDRYNAALAALAQAKQTGAQRIAAAAAARDAVRAKALADGFDL